MYIHYQHVFLSSFAPFIVVFVYLHKVYWLNLLQILSEFLKKHLVWLVVGAIVFRFLVPFLFFWSLRRVFRQLLYLVKDRSRIFPLWFCKILDWFKDFKSIKATLLIFPSLSFLTSLYTTLKSSRVNPQQVPRGNAILTQLNYEFLILILKKLLELQQLLQTHHHLHSF